MLFETNPIEVLIKNVKSLNVEEKYETYLEFAIACYKFFKSNYGNSGSYPSFLGTFIGCYNYYVHITQNKTIKKNEKLELFAYEVTIMAGNIIESTGYIDSEVKFDALSAIYRRFIHDIKEKEID